jgi:hypothetical protein
MRNNAINYRYIGPLRDEAKKVVWILNDELLNDLHFPKSFLGEQIIIKYWVKHIARTNYKYLAYRQEYI